MQHFKIGIIGGGAAGLMVAISASENEGRDIALFESGSRCGTKILMSGGTRCNITNQSVRPEHFFGNKNFIKNVLLTFGDRDALKFLERLGIKLKVEAGGKYFPDDDDAGTVLGALLNKIDEQQIKVFYDTKINAVQKDVDNFIIHSGNESITVQKLIIATGGKSYPSTGSDGSGYEIAASLGHTIVRPFPALTPILLDEPALTSLSGITIPAQLRILSGQKVIVEFSGSLLLTHFGISGPAALNISRELERLRDEKISLQINFLPSFSSGLLEREIKENVRNTPNKLVISYFRELLPVKLVSKIIEKSGLNSEKKFNTLSSIELKNLISAFTASEVKFTGVKGFKQAEVTAGGVPLNEIRYQTMESRIQRNLHFAGEILDVDGIIGGYNFQWAWSTGYIAGKSAAKG